MNSYETLDGISGQLDYSPKVPAHELVSYKYDLHLVYLAFMKHFRDLNIPWEKLPFSSYFRSFESFLAFSWHVITVADRMTGELHITVTHNSIRAFKTMIIKMHPEAYPVVPDVRCLVRLVDPSERSSRSRVQISDYDSYSGLLANFPIIPAISYNMTSAFSAFKRRINVGDCNEIRKVWNMKDRTFLAMNFLWNEEDLCFEWGYAALCCSQLNSRDHWPPNPNTDYRKGHFIVAEYVDKITNNDCLDYSFGKSQVISKDDLPKIIKDTISIYLSANSDSVPNTLIVVAHNFGVTFKRLKMMEMELPFNVLDIDTTALELNLFRAGYRGKMSQFKTNKEFRLDSSSIYVEPKQERDPITVISLKNLLLTLETHPVLPISHQADCQLDQRETNHAGVQDEGVTPNAAPIGIPNVFPEINLRNPGNRSVMCLYVLQKMLDPQCTKAPEIVAKTETGLDLTRKSKL